MRQKLGHASTRGTSMEVEVPLASTYQGNLLRGIDKITVRRKGVLICLLMFSSQ